MTKQEKLMKMLAMEESRKKSRAKIFYTSDRTWLLPSKGRYRKTEATKFSPRVQSDWKDVQSQKDAYHDFGTHPKTAERCKVGASV